MKQTLEMVFSGGRGYHLHVRSSTVFDLGSQERREIVNYVTGTGLDTSLCIRETPYKKIERGKFPAEIKTRRVLKKDYGWNKRIYKGALDYVERLTKIEEYDKRISHLTKNQGTGKKRAETILERLFSDEAGAHGVGLLREGNIDIFGNRQTAERFLNIAFKHAIAISKSEVDKPVTGDIHRLIRTPGSLHGKSGLRVTPLASYKELDDFDPLSDAVVFSEEPAKVSTLRNATFSLKGEKFLLKEDEIVELPEYAAVFALGMGFAEIGE